MIYYVCPKDGTRSNEMNLARSVKPSTEEIKKLGKESPVIGERLLCPECWGIYGWHELLEKEEIFKKVKEEL